MRPLHTSTHAASEAAKYVMSSGFVDYYELLQVDDDATPSDIKAAYRSLAKACHPDILGDAEGHNICILLNEAYEVASNFTHTHTHTQLLTAVLAFHRC